MTFTDLRRRLGVLIYVRRPSVRGYRALNGQRGRRALVAELVAVVAPTVLVETGTHRGRTALHLARSTAVQVHTVEADAATLARVRSRLEKAGVRVHLGDSREVLRRLPDAGVSPMERVVFYLDAHWGPDLPLAEELEVIGSTWNEWVAVIDDFQVPDDPAYLYDDYGPDRTLCADYLLAVGIPPDRIFFPVLPGARESGARRGCAVVVSSGAVRSLVAEMTSMRQLDL